MKFDFGRDDSIRSLAWNAEQRAEQWQIAIDQACTIEAIERLEQSLHDRIELGRKRERSVDMERHALILCAQRRADLLAEVHPALSPAAPGGLPAVQDAHAVNPLAQETW